MSDNRHHIFFVLCLMLVAGLFVMDQARALPSIAMAATVLLGISYLIWKPTTTQDVQYRPYLFLAATFLVLLPSWFYSDNKFYLFEKWQVALPYLMLPPAFVLIPVMPARKYMLLYQLFFMLVLFIAFFAFINYLFNQDQINALYLASKVMPTYPVSHHPTFSIMIAFAVFTGYRLFLNGHIFRFRFERWWHQ